MKVRFPHRLLRQGLHFSMIGTSLATQQSISGATTVTPTPRGRWKATAQFALNGEADVLSWLAFIAQMDGRNGTTLVPADARFRAKDEHGLPLPYCDHSNIKNMQTFEHWGFEGTNIRHISVKGAYPVRATEMNINLLRSTGLRPGHQFSIGERLYRVQEAWQTVDGDHRIMFQPPLRQAVANDAQIEIARPVCRMRFASEDEGVIDQVFDVLPSVTVNFEEA